MTRKEQEDLHARVLDRVRRMTPKEGFRSLIESGIFTEQGELSPEYGGPKRHSQGDNLTNQRPSEKDTVISRVEHERILRRVINHWRRRYERLEKRTGT